MWIWKNRAEIDVIEWDKYLQHSSSQQIELSSWYLDIVAQHWGAFYHKASGARIPVVYHTKWIFINQVYRPSFIQYNISKHFGGNTQIKPYTVNNTKISLWSI